MVPLHLISLYTSLLGADYYNLGNDVDVSERADIEYYEIPHNEKKDVNSEYAALR